MFILYDNLYVFVVEQCILSRLSDVSQVIIRLFASLVPNYAALVGSNSNICF